MISPFSPHQVGTRAIDSLAHKEQRSPANAPTLSQSSATYSVIGTLCLRKMLKLSLYLFFIFLVFFLAFTGCQNIVT